MNSKGVDLPITPAERAVYLPGADALVLADVHLGRAAASSVESTLGGDADVVDRIRALLGRWDPATVVVAGDLLHSFSRVPRGVEEALAAVEASVEAAGGELVVTPGNHDALLERVYTGTRAESYRLDDGETVVCHGHERPAVDGERFVVGHDHPALSVDGRKRPCFLYGPAAFEGADVVVLPAFTRLAPGATINRMRGGDFQSPLVRHPNGFHPGIYDEGAEETLWFPPLGKCRRLL